MTAKSNDYTQQLEKLARALVEDVLAAPDDEILAVGGADDAREAQAALRAARTQVGKAIKAWHRHNKRRPRIRRSRI